MMIIAMVLGLFFLLLGWTLMPLLRYRLKKRMEKMRADQAEDIGSGFHYRETRYRETRGADGSYHAINVQLMQLGAELPMDAVLFPFAITWRRREVYGWLDEHPFLELEQSADQLAWQARATLPVTDLTDLEEDWRQHVRASLRGHLSLLSSLMRREPAKIRCWPLRFPPLINEFPDRQGWVRSNIELVMTITGLR